MNRQGGGELLDQGRRAPSLPLGQLGLLLDVDDLELVTAGEVAVAELVMLSTAAGTVGLIPRDERQKTKTSSPCAGWGSSGPGAWVDDLASAG